MEQLSELHLDALTEVFNIGAGRAAASLSEIVGDEVKLSVPSIEIKKTVEADATIIALNSARFGAVSQHFSGPFDAQAVLLAKKSTVSAPRSASRISGDHCCPGCRDAAAKKADTPCSVRFLWINRAASASTVE